MTHIGKPIIGSENTHYTTTGGRQYISIARKTFVVLAVVALTWAGLTFGPLIINGLKSSSRPVSHILLVTHSSATGANAGLDDSVAYAVADVVSGSQKDRDSLDGKTVKVAGYLVATTAKSQQIGDSPKLSKDSLTILPVQPKLRNGAKAIFVGVYHSRTNTLNVTNWQAAK